jgi:asparagine synthase (glutamine-hydrolysing)
MCGIAGIVRARADEPVGEDALRRMARALRHRGPDGFGLARGAGAGFVSTRLAIFDIPGGWQPMRGARGTLLVYNGEVYNHPELRAELARGGRAFHTTSDTEVVHALLERDGLAALHRLNGQFALAWWEPAARRLTLVRDRFGVRPLQWAALPGGGIAFASEAKALFASGEVQARPDLDGIDEVFTTWGALAPRTAFKGVHQLPPGGVLTWQDGAVAESRWWEPDCAPDAPAPAPGELAALLEDAVRLRLRADVPVGTYLSGGLDSSLVTALAQRVSEHELRTFSVAFHDARYDERPFQQHVAEALGTRHHVVEAGPHEIADAFEDVVWHAETPLIRTAPVPLALLARATRAHGITVVATGEGADELFWGYDLFKETAVRALHAREPARAEALLDGLYPYLHAPTAAAGAGGADVAAGRRGAAWRRFFLDAGEPDDLLFSHQPRIAATAGARALYRDELRTQLGDPLARLRAALPAAFAGWGPLQRAAYLELTTLLSANLLAAQGDRVAMASGVEGRFPFLDHRVFAHAARLPAERKLAGLAGSAAGDLREKAQLRELAARVLPPQIAQRPKLPYRAPEVAPFFGDGAPREWVAERLSPAALEAAGIFDAARVAQLVRRCAQGRARAAREQMAFVGVLSTQVWHERFAHASHPAEDGEPRVALDLTVEPREHAGSAA